ncbi:efflux RND transporter permease subunit [candidate division KSB1 bacterium]|nr:efflux RND transporter permease subunit [candidate division KSB1 bacterium]
MNDIQENTLLHSTGGYVKFVTSRPVAILMITIAILVFGWISYEQLALNLMPDISYPSLTVRTDYPGTAPEEVETMISRPIEQALGIVSNLKNISSISKAGMSDVVLEFDWDTDMNDASQDVREKLEQVWLPQEVKRPILLRYDPSLDPIIRLGLYSNDQSAADLFLLRRISEEEIQRELEEIKGIAAVKVKGGFEEEIVVEMNEVMLATLGLNINQINSRLQQENVNLAGGNLKEGDTEYLVRTMNEFKNLDEIRNIVVGELNDAEVRIKDIGRVRRTNKERTVITRVNGRESVEIEIYKEADANIVEIARTIRNIVFGTPGQQAYVSAFKERQEKAKADTSKAVAAKKPEKPDKMLTNFLAYEMPEGVQIELLSDQSTFIKNAVDEVKNTAIIGGILAILVLYLFLNKFSSTVIIGLAIPISIVATFGPMFMSNVSLNIMSLGGLALGIGMLVDNSIVVLESIFRCKQEGDSVIEAAQRGTREVSSAVFAATLTTIAVFFPIVFVKGVAGQVFGDMALTVVFSLLASLAVALFFIPMLASRNFANITSFNFKRSKFVDFMSVNRLKMLREKHEKENTKTPILHIIFLFLLLPIELLFRLFLLLLVIPVLLSKIILILIGVFIWPVLAVFRISGYEETSKSTWIERFAESNSFFALNFDFFWETLLSIFAVSRLGRSIRYYRNLISTSGALWKKILLVLCIPLCILYWQLRYFCEIVLIFLLKLLLMLALALYLIGTNLGLFVAMAVKPVAWVVSKLFERLMNAVSEAYPRVIAWALDNKAAVITMAVALSLVAFLLLMPRLGSELIPQVHQGEFNVEITLPVGTPVEKTDQFIRPIQRWIKNLDEVDRTAEVIGAELTSVKTSDKGEHTGSITVALTESGGIERTEENAIRKIREQVNQYPDVETKISHPVLFSFKTPIEIEIRGYNLTTLKQFSRLVERRIAKVRGLTDIKSNIQSGNPEIQIKYNRTRMAHFGLNIADVANLVRNKVLGNIATEFRERDRLIDIRVRLREEDKETVENLQRLVVNPDNPIPIRLGDIADIITKEGPSEIRRIGQQRAALITANIVGADLGSVTKEIESILERITWPSDFAYEIGGQNKEMKVSIESLQLALLLAIFLIYVVMASQFESLIHPLVIMFTIPLALIGVIFILWMLNIPLSVIVFIGLIMLVGIVVNNAIVLVDYINHLRKTGLSKYDAIIEGGKIRLRPILMTTMTTVLGLFPMALGLGEGSEIRTPMAITVIAGLISSTVLTLVVIPTVYAIFDRSK